MKSEYFQIYKTISDISATLRIYNNSLTLNYVS